MLPPEISSRVSLKTFWAAPWASVGTAAMEKTSLTGSPTSSVLVEVLPEAVLPEAEAAGVLLPQEASRPIIMTALRQRAMLLFQFFM